MSHAISNIKFELEEHAIPFTFTKSYQNNEQGEAFLQLPDTGDSVHSIDGIEQGDWDEAQTDIFTQLSNYYFAQFKSADEAAASALLGQHIEHVEEVDGYYVAFSGDLAYLLVESPYRSYYNKAALFDLAINNNDGEFDASALISKAKSEYSAMIKRQQEEQVGFDQERFPR